MRQLTSLVGLAVAGALAFGSMDMAPRETTRAAPERAAPPPTIGSDAAEPDADAVAETLDRLLPEVPVGFLFEADTPGVDLPLDVRTSAMGMAPGSADYIGLVGLGRFTTPGGTVWVTRIDNDTGPGEDLFHHLSRDDSGGWRKTDIGSTAAHMCDFERITTAALLPDGILAITVAERTLKCEGEEAEPTVSRARLHPDGRREEVTE